ncbi:MAG: hypothetical protein GF405_00370 [Candidatus Eisenbacteria bacterium]|nr:hypothetical protein [Candidatus Eisenbacteria bacterium]
MAPQHPGSPARAPQRSSLGPAAASGAAGRAPLLLAALLVVALVLPPSAGASAPAEADREALLARGIELFLQNEFAAALSVLTRIVEEHPDWRPGTVALGSALLRAGRHEEARPLYEELVGAPVARALGEGSLAAEGLPPNVEPDAVLGLGMVHELAGEARQAENTYRTFADIVGPAEPAASRAYRRLALLFRETDVPWGNAEAESLKAEAVDRDGVSGQALPAFPDAETIPELEPYLRTIERSPDRPESLSRYEEAPWLARWEGPPADGATRLRNVRVEIRVDTLGNPVEATVLDATLADSTAAVVSSTVKRWRFVPARLDGRPTDAWIVMTSRAVLPPRPDPEVSADSTAVGGDAPPVPAQAARGDTTGGTQHKEQQGSSETDEAP